MVGMNSTRLIVYWPLIAFFGLAIAACSRPSLGPEQEIRDLIDAAEHAAESNEMGVLAEIVDTAYQDARGDNRESLIQILRLYGIGAGVREIVTKIENIVINGVDAADVRLTVRFAAAQRGRFALDAGQYDVNLELLRSDDGVWTVISARWERAGGTVR